MRLPTIAERLGPFEVFAGRDLSVGRPLVARLIGRRFDQVLEESNYEKPFDPRFGKAMVKTLSYLCTTLGCSFGFVERTEISLFAVAGGGDARRLLSRIAGEAAGKLSVLLGQVMTFETRLYEFPDHEGALEYFRWRQNDANSSAIDRYCTFVLAQSGADQAAVPRILDGLGADEKVELLRQNGLDFQAVAAWQRLGAVVRLKPAEAQGQGQGQGQTGNGVTQGRLVVDLNLPAEDQFADYLKRALT